jgi:hypothetical protein
MDRNLKELGDMFQKTNEENFIDIEAVCIV